MDSKAEQSIKHTLDGFLAAGWLDPAEHARIKAAIDNAEATDLARADQEYLLSGPSLTAQQVAERLGVTVRTVREWQASGQLPGYKIVGVTRYKISDLRALTEPCTADTAAGAKIPE